MQIIVVPGESWPEFTADPQALQLSRHWQLSRKVGHQATVSSHSSVLPSSSAQNWSPLTAASCGVLPSLCSRVAAQPSEKIDACISFFFCKREPREWGDHSLFCPSAALCQKEMSLIFSHFYYISGVSQSLATGTDVVFVLFDPASFHLFLPDAQKMPLCDINKFQRQVEAAIKKQWWDSHHSFLEIWFQIWSFSSKACYARARSWDEKVSESLINHAEETPSAIGKHQHSSHSFVVANSRLVQASQPEFWFNLT